MSRAGQKSVFELSTSVAWEAHNEHVQAVLIAGVEIGANVRRAKTARNGLSPPADNKSTCVACTWWKSRANRDVIFGTREVDACKQKEAKQRKIATTIH